MPQPSIAILGAGLAGLTLGRCLRQRGIACVIYEQASNERYLARHRYAMTMQPWGYKSLLEDLNIEEAAFRSHIAIEAPNQESAASSFRACRNKLEAFLAEGQDIRFEHQCYHASVSGTDGQIEIDFNRAETIKPVLLVDALGVHSNLRRKLCPKIGRELHPFAVYNGKRFLPPEVFNATYAAAFADSSVLVPPPSHPGDPRLEISLNGWQPDGKMSMSYIYSRPATRDDPVANMDRRKSDAKDTPQELYRELVTYMATTSSLSDVFRECFDPIRLKADRLLHWLMRSVLMSKHELLSLLHQNRVIFLGDSAHAVPILGAQGGNLAMLDAVNLARTLAGDGDIMWRNWEAVEDSKPKLEEYYQANWTHWKDAVNNSREVLVDMHKPSPDMQSKL